MTHENCSNFYCSVTSGLENDSKELNSRLTRFDADDKLSTTIQEIDDFFTYILIGNIKKIQ